MKLLLAAFLALCLALQATQALRAQDTPKPAVTNDPSAALYQSDALLTVSINLKPEDWDQLCSEHHDLLAALGPTRFDNPEPKPYKTYRADVTINGTPIPGVGVRKRGFVGSSSFERPSLGIRFDEFDKQKEFCAIKRLSLNNNLQDPSQMHQVLAYRVFAKAGVPAPRCNLAHVTVNGKSLGIYSNVEPVEDEFLKRHFGTATGNLYEGQISDFRPDWVKTFERKNNKKNASRSDLENVVTALQSKDAKLLQHLQPLVDVDAYLRYWSVEMLIGHWDSYSANGNNFFVYRHPADGKFRFIPWGADSVFGDRNPFARQTMPESVRARSMLPHRLYKLPAIREQYRTCLLQLLKTAWDEQELLRETDRMEALVKNELHFGHEQFSASLGKVRQFIRTRRATLETELATKAPDVDIPLKNSACLEKAGTVTMSFETTWEKTRPQNPLQRGTANLTLDWEGAEQVFSAVGVIATPSEDARNAGSPSITVIGSQGANLKVLAFIVQPKFFRRGTNIPLDGFQIGGVLLTGSMLGFNFELAALPVGTMKLLQAGTNPGDRVIGKIKADLYRLPR